MQLIGREPERDELRRVVDEVAGGAGRTVLLTGAAGMGKTSLAEAALERAATAGFVTAVGAAWGMGGAPPLWPWIQLLRTLAQEMPRRGRSESWDARLEALLASPGAWPRSGAGDRFALFDSATAEIAAMAERRPLALLLDDLQWADDASWDLALFAARSLRHHPVALLVTCREQELSEDPTRRQRLPLLQRESLVLPLAAMEDEHCAELFEAVARRRPTAAETGRLVAATGGNPLFVTDLARLARQRPLETLDVLVDEATPATSRAAVERLAALLDEPTRAWLRAAAVLGSGRHVELLRELTGTENPKLSRAEALGLVIRAPGSGFEFAHDLSQTALREALPQEERARLHARAARWLEQRAEAGESPYEIADHYLQAGPEHAHAAARWALTAAEKALGSFGAQLAVEYADAALGRLDDRDAELACDLRVVKIEAMVAMGRRLETSDLLLESFSLARRARDDRRLARAALAWGIDFYRPGSPVDEELMAALEEAVQAAPEDDPARSAKLLADLSLLTMLSDRSGGTEQAERALSLAEASGETEAVVRALVALTFATGADRLDEGLAHATRIVELAERGSHSDWLVVGLARRTAVLLERRQLQAYDADAERIAHVAERTALPLHAWLAHSLRTTRTFITGPLDRHAELVQRDLGLLPDHAGAATAWSLETWAHQMLTVGPDPPLAMLDASLREAKWGSIQAPRCGLIAACGEAGHLDRLRQQLDDVLREVPGWERDALWLTCVAWLGWGASAGGDDRTCRLLYDLLVPYEEHVIFTHIGLPVGYMGVVAWVLGLLAHALGEQGAACGHMERAIRLQAGLGDRCWLVYVKARYAQILHEQGAAGDAAMLAAEAKALSNESGLAAVAALVEPVLGRPDESHVQLTRDGDTWMVEYRGRSVRLRDLRGLSYIARLAETPGAEVHVLGLVAPVGTTGGIGPSLELPALAGPIDDPVLDERAKREYRDRLERLEDEIEKAERHHDLERTTRLRAERDLLSAELSRALGLHGRDRRHSSAAERTRVAVTKSIRLAIARVESKDAVLGEHLRRAVRTGTFCSYSPKRSSHGRNRPGYA